MCDKSLVVPPDVGGDSPLATLTISVDEIFTGLNPSGGLQVAFKWWGSDYTHYFPTPVSLQENSITYYVHTRTGVFQRYLKAGPIKFNLMEGKQLIGSATTDDVDNIISKKLFTTLLPVCDTHGYKIAVLRVTFKYSLLEEDEKISKVASNVTKFSMSKIVDDTNKIRSQIAASALAECDSSRFLKNLPFEEFRTKSQEAKVVDFIQGKEMTKEEEEEALRALHCTSPVPSVLHLSRPSIETPRNESIYESDPGSDLEKMVKKTTSSALIERGIQFSKDSIVNAFTRTKNALNIGIDSYRLGISKLILTNTGLRKIFNIPPYNFNGTYPTGTEFIFEYHPISSLGKSWFRPFIVTAKQFDQNVVKFNQYMISKIKNSPDPWKLVNELCEGSEIKVYWKHSNEKLPSLLGATKYPSNSSTENFSKNLCLPLYTKYKLHVGNLLMKVELGSGLVFGKALVDAEPFDPREAPDDRITFRSMSEDSKRNKVPKILSKNAVTFVDQTKKMLKTQYELLDDQLSDNLLTKLKGRSRTEVKKKSDRNNLFPIYDEPSTEESVREPTTSTSSHASLGMDSVSNLKPYSYSGKNSPPRQKNVKKNRKKTKFDSTQLPTINVECESSLPSSPERKAKKTSLSPKQTSSHVDEDVLHVFKICVDESVDFVHDSYNFFLEYKFLNVDDNFNVFWDPKIYRIDLGFSLNSQIHNLQLPENVTLSEAFNRLEKKYLSIQFFARAITTKRTLLISQLNIPLDEISFPEIRSRGRCFRSYPWSLDYGQNIPKGSKLPKEMTLEVLYVKSSKESDTQVELNKLEEELSHEIFSRKVGSKQDWRDEFKEPAISRDPITGELKSSRLDSKEDSKLMKLQEKCSFPVTNSDSNDFKPRSRPSFLSSAENDCFPPEVDFVDLETTSICDENPFETRTELVKKQLWTNQESKFESFAAVDQTELPANKNSMHEQIVTNDRSDVLVLSSGVDDEIKRGRQKRDELDKFLHHLDEKEYEKTVIKPNVDEIIELSSEDEGKKKEVGVYDVECDIFPSDGRRLKKTFSKTKNDFCLEEPIDQSKSDFENFRPFRSKIAELDKFEREEFDSRKFFRSECENQSEEKENFRQLNSESIENPKIFETHTIDSCSKNPTESHKTESISKNIFDKIVQLNNSELTEDAELDLNSEDLYLEEKKLIEGIVTKAEVLRLLKKYKKELEEESEDYAEYEEKMKSEDVASSVISLEKELQQNKPLPKKVHVNIEVESALNLLVAVCKKNGTEANPVLPTSRVELTTEVNGKTLILKSPWVHDARAPLYEFSEDVDLPSDMFFKKNKKLEINVRAKVKGETYMLKTLIDLTPISAGRMGLAGVYFLHLGTKAQGILLVNIRPLDNVEPLREAWENTFGLDPPSVENFESDLGQFEEHYMKNLTEMQSMIEEMGDMLENKDWKQPDPGTIKRIMSFKNSSPTCTPTYIKKYTETLDDNWTAESYLKSRIKPQNIKRTSDDLNVKKVIDIDDNSFDEEFDIEILTNPHKDGLDAATNSIDKIIQEIRKHHIDD